MSMALQSLLTADFLADKRKDIKEGLFMTKKMLQGKVIVVSGGPKGVGRAAVERFSSEGAAVVIGGRDEEAARKILRLVKAAGGRGTYIHTDLRYVDDCIKLMDSAYQEYGRIDGLFNYAGITPVSPLDSCGEDTFNDVMNINFRAAFFCCQKAVKYMRMHGGGSIVLTGSAHAWGGQKDRAAYACSKGVLLTLMEHISHNYACEHIRCNYLTLGWTPTEGEVDFRNSLGENESALRERAAGILPMGRMCERTDYLGGLVYLMSDESSMMTGSVFRITAGEYI